MPYAHTQTVPNAIPLSLVTFGAAHPFSSLSTEVTDEAVTVKFRLGWPKRTISRSQITNVEIVRNKWWYGLGIRLIPGSTTMFNVWGLDAVHLTLEGRRNFRIGTDDPKRLAAAIQNTGPSTESD